jgi:hypothetical protein
MSQLAPKAIRKEISVTFFKSSALCGFFCFVLFVSHEGDLRVSQLRPPTQQKDSIAGSLLFAQQNKKTPQFRPRKLRL